MFFIVCGIEPAEPGFKSVLIAPSLGNLKWISARMPHLLGEITVEFKRRGLEGFSGRIALPAGLTARFLRKNHIVDLKGDEQRIDF